MEMDEVDAILEKVWDLHDKLSDAIHSVSRSHFLKTLAPNQNRKSALNEGVDEAAGGGGFVYVKDFKAYDESAVHEAKSLNAIRTALESLEDQLDFFQTVQTQQRAERDAALARLEQSRIVLAMRLADHQGKKYKVIEEALAFVGDVNNDGSFASKENLFSFVNRSSQDGKKTNPFIKAITSTIGFAKNSLKLDHVGGILGNAALVAISMLAMLHVNHLVYKDSYNSEPLQSQGRRTYSSNTTSTQLERTSASHSSQLDVLLARG